MLDLNDVHFFVQVVDRGGFSAAARALLVPTSTLSHRIQQLEAALGVTLLARTSRKVTATHDPRASPLLGIPEHLPPLLIQVGSEEIVYDDAVGYAQRARAAGHDVTLQEWTGMHHVFQLNVEQLEGARQALDATAAFLDEHMER
jgi:acetyl esterase/lipase